MTDHDPLQALDQLLEDATKTLDELWADDALVRLQNMMDRMPAADRHGLVEIVAGEMAICTMRRRPCLWTRGSRMYVNRSARIYARSATESTPAQAADALRETTAQGTIRSVAVLAAQLGEQPDEIPLSFATTLATLSTAQQDQVQALTDRLLNLLDPSA